MKALVLFFLFIGCQQNTSEENPKVSQLKGYRDLAFGMTEEEFKGKFYFIDTQFKRNISKKTVEVSCKPGDYGVIDGVYFDKMQLDFFDDSLTSISLNSTKKLYSRSDAERVLSLFKQKYGAVSERENSEGLISHRWSGGNNSINFDFSDKYGLVIWSITYRNFKSFQRALRVEINADSVDKAKQIENI